MDRAISITRGGHRTFLKWHRARRRADDPIFTGRRIIEGLKAGASVEVDLVIHGDAGFAVLHDLTLDRETTGSGPVKEASAQHLRGLCLRNEAGVPLPDRVMLLEDLADLLLREGAHPEGLLQLDFKEGQEVTEASVADFDRIVGPVARRLILSSGDIDAVRCLSNGIEGLRIGHDPCHFGALERLRATSDFAGFVRAALDAAPLAEVIYLDYHLIFAAEVAGIDLVAAFHAADRKVDAYTIRCADDAGIEAAVRLLALRVDQITTDDPEGLGAALV